MSESVSLRVPASCPACGLIYPSGIEVGAGSLGIAFYGSKARCPRCGTWGHIIDGVLDVLDQTIRVVRGSDFTVRTLRAMRLAVEDVRSGAATPIEASKRRLQIQWPEVADLFRRWASLANVANLATILTACLAVSQCVFEWDSRASNMRVENAAIEEFNKFLDDDQPLLGQPLRTGKLPAQHEVNGKRRQQDGGGMNPNREKRPPRSQ